MDTKTASLAFSQRNQWADKLSHTIEKVSPVVWQTTLAVYRADAIGSLVTTALWFLLMAIPAIVCAVIAVHIWNAGNAYQATEQAAYRKSEVKAGFSEDEIDVSNVPDMGAYITAWAVTICASIGFGIGALVNFASLTNYWTWIAAFYPQLAVAHDILQKVMNH
jgi:hypothetical protein